jgi:hypothetical protein
MPPNEQDEPQKKCARFWKNKNLLPVPEIKPWFLACLDRRPVIPPTMFSSSPQRLTLVITKCLSLIRKHKTIPQRITVYAFICLKLDLGFCEDMLSTLKQYGVILLEARHKQILYDHCHKYCLCYRNMNI